MQHMTQLLIVRGQKDQVLYLMIDLIRGLPLGCHTHLLSLC